MSMGLMMVPSLRQLQRCDCCAGDRHNHEAGCPRQGLEAFVDELWKTFATCPACHENLGVAVNTDDYWECKKCRTQFSSGELVCGGEDPDTLERVILLNIDANMAITVLQMKHKGRRRFKHRAVLRMYREQIQLRRRELRALRKAAKEGAP